MCVCTVSKEDSSNPLPFQRCDEHDLCQWEKGQVARKLCWLSELVAKGQCDREKGEISRKVGWL